MGFLFFFRLFGVGDGVWTCFSLSWALLFSLISSLGDGVALLIVDDFFFVVVPTSP